MIIFLFLGLAQFFFEGIAQEINSRFKELGYEMKANPGWSLFTVSQFWSEARRKNFEYKDQRIAKLLLYRTVWWVLIMLTFIVMIITGR